MSVLQQKNPFEGRMFPSATPARTPINFAQQKDNGRRIKLEQGRKDFVALVATGKRDELLHDFAQMKLPNSKWRNEFARTALEMTKGDVTADWQLLLKGCAVAWADDLKLQKESQKDFAGTLRKINLAVLNINPVDQHYIDAVKNGVKMALLNRQEPYRARNLLNVQDEHIVSRMKGRVARLFRFRNTAKTLLQTQRISNRHTYALKRYEADKQQMQLEYLLLSDEKMERPKL